MGPDFTIASHVFGENTRQELAIPDTEICKFRKKSIPR